MLHLNQVNRVRDFVLPMKELNTEALEVLIPVLKHSNESWRVLAVEALGELGDKGAVEALIELINDGSISARFSVISSLAKLADARALPYLEKLENDPILGVNATTAIETIKDAVAGIGPIRSSRRHSV